MKAYAKSDAEWTLELHRRTHMIDTEGHEVGVKPLLEPRCGWQEGLERLMRGQCPWCGHVVLGLSYLEEAPGREHLTWACIDGCNP